MLKYLGEKKKAMEERAEIGSTSTPSGPSAAALLEAANALTALHETRPQAPVVAPTAATTPPAAACSEAETKRKLRQKKHRDAAAVACDRNASFPERLMAVLSDPDASSSVSWLPDGLSFVVTSPQKLTLEILPRYFGQTEFASFTRKLYWWGFKKTSRSKSSGSEADSYRHELFQRDQPELASRMRGAPVKRKRKAAGATKAATANSNKAQKTAKSTPASPPPSTAATTSAVDSLPSPRSTPAPQQQHNMNKEAATLAAARAALLAGDKLGSLGGNLTPAERTALLLKSSNAMVAASLLQRQRELNAATAAALRTSNLLKASGALSRTTGLTTQSSSQAQASSSSSAANGNNSNNNTIPSVADLPVRYAQLLATRALQAQTNANNVGGGGLSSSNAVSAQAFYANALQRARAAQAQQQQHRRDMQDLAAARAIHQRARRMQQVQQAQHQQATASAMQQRGQQQQGQASSSSAAASSTSSSHQGPTPVVIHVHHHHMHGGKTYTTMSRNSAA